MVMRIEEVPPIWISVLSDKKTIVIVANRDTPVRLPELRPPFSTVSIKAAVREAGLEGQVRVIHGENSKAASKIRAAVHAETSAKNFILKAVQASPDVGARTWADANERKLGIDERIGRLKRELGEVRSRAYTSGVYADPTWYREAEAELGQLKLESQALQVAMGKYREDERRQNAKLYGERNRLFRQKAKEILPDNLYRTVYEATEEAFLDIADDEAV